MEFKAGPEGGGNSTSTKESFRNHVQRVNEFVIATLWVGINGYILYAFCYVVLWRRVRFRNRGAAIAILVIFCVLNFYAVLSWVAIHRWGAGRVTEKYTRLSGEDAEVAFLCDEHGYSLYCSYCKHIKPNRTHHSSSSDTCVPVMDHFCPWVGTVIGQGNYKFFLQFCWGGFLGVLLVLITLFIYQHDRVPHINGNSIALYIVTGITGTFFFMLIVQHTTYVMLSHTTIEHMGYRKNKMPYINLLWHENERRIIQPTRADIAIPQSSPFTEGKWQNILNVMGPIYTWILPIRGPVREPRFNPRFLDEMRKRIKE